MSWKINFESIKKDTNFFAKLNNNNEIVNLNEIISTFEAETEGGKKHTWFRLFDDYIEFFFRPKVFTCERKLGKM